jgi:hypothetical protein
MVANSETLLLVTLPSANRAVYSVQPQHLPREGIPGSNEWPIMWGQQIAHELDGIWYRPGGWTPIDDRKAVALLERCPMGVTP